MKEKMLMVAESLDAFRIVPRIILSLYGFMIYKVVDWFMLLPDPTTQQAALVSTIIGGAAAIIGLYNNSGRSWTKSDS